MSEPVHKRSSALGTTLFVVIVLTIVYPLSMGPFNFLYNRHYLPEFVCDAGDAFYEPISWLSFNTGVVDQNPIGRGYMRYIEWWENL